MTTFDALLVAATVLCSLVAGFLFAFAVVVMPGLKRLDDAAFIRAFQVIDGVIQKSQPLFMFVWMGSVVSIIAAAMMGLWQLSGVQRVLLFVAALVHLLGVHAPTVRINVPLNNQLQRLDPIAMDETTRRSARADFERRWNQWNVFRTACAVVTSVMLVALLLRL